MPTNQIENYLVHAIVAACPELSTEQVALDASLTLDLGLDSLVLTELFAGIKQQFGRVELAPWFIAGSNTGADTLRSLAAFIAGPARVRVAA